MDGVNKMVDRCLKNIGYSFCMSWSFEYPFKNLILEFKIIWLLCQIQNFKQLWGADIFNFYTSPSTDAWYWNLQDFNKNEWSFYLL